MGVLDNLTALKGGYELGQAVFGQDEASKRQALMEKQLGLESALRVKQLEDAQAYQQGQLANDWERNRIAEDQYQRANKLGWGQVAAQERGQDVHQNIANLQNLTAQRGQDITSRHYDTQAGLQQKALELRRLVADGTISYQQAQVELERQRNGIQQQNVNQMGAYYGALTGAKQQEIQQARDIEDLRGLTSKVYTGNLHGVSQEQLQRLAPLVEMANLPDLAKHVGTIEQIKPGGKATPEQLAATQAIFGPFMQNRLNATDSEGHKIVSVPELTSVEPGGQPGTLRIKMRMKKAKPDGAIYDTEHYLTQDGIPEKDGGSPLDIPVQDMSAIYMTAKDLAGVQAAHPERLQALKDTYNDMLGATSMSEVVSNKYKRLAANVGVEKAAELQDKELAERKAALETDLSKELDMRSGFSPKAISAVASGDPAAIDALTKEEGRPVDVKAIQNYQATKANLINKIRRAHLDSAGLSDLRQDTAGALLDSLPEGALNGVLGSALPRGATSQYQPPSSGQIQNDPNRYGPGGGSSPLSQAAPDAGGILKSHLAAGKSAEHLTGLRGPFADRLAAMLRDAPGPVSIYSGYRSPQRQAQIFAGSDHSGHRVAHPGHSNHNHGVAADLKYASPAVRRWVHENASKYGLAFRMPWEPWHIEPAGAGPDARNWGI